MSESLKNHLSAINLYEGEVQILVDVSCAITIRMLGVNDGGVNQHLGWTSKQMLDQYTTKGGLCSPKGAALSDRNLDKFQKHFNMKHFIFLRGIDALIF